VEGWNTGRLEEGSGRLEDWKGRCQYSLRRGEKRKVGRLEERKDGPCCCHSPEKLAQLEGWKESWNIGRLEEWKVRRLEG